MLQQKNILKSNTGEDTADDGGVDSADVGDDADTLSVKTEHSSA